MLVFSEYQTGTIDLALSFYGYEECTPNYSFGPAIRDTYVLHYITKGQGKFHYKGKIVDLKEGDFFLLKPEELTFYQADSKEPWAYYWLGITGGKPLIILLFLKFLINLISSNLKLVIPRLLQNSSQTLSASLRLQNQVN